jgi:hypothetical protein
VADIRYQYYDMSGTRYGSIAIHNNDDDDVVDKAVAAAVEGGYHHHEGAPLLKHQQQSALSILSEYWSHLTFHWITPLLARGNAAGQLSISDLRDWSLPTNCQTTEVYSVFCHCWEEELGRVQQTKNSNNSNKNGNTKNGSSNGKEEMTAKEGDEATLLMDGLLSDTTSSKFQQEQPSLIWTLYNSFGTDFINAGYLKLIHDACLFVGPQVLNRLIHFVRTPEYTLTYGLGLVAAGEIRRRRIVIASCVNIETLTTLLLHSLSLIFCHLSQIIYHTSQTVTLSQITISICLRHYFYKCTCAGLRIRTAIIIAIYKKSLLLSLNERHRRGGAGQIATLVGIDAQRLQDLLTYLHAVWYSFFQIGLAMYFLWGQLGVSCLAGLVVIILMIPTTNVIGQYQGKIQKTLMKARDERTALNSEMLSSMKVIKIQAWEEDFRTKLLALRSIELHRLWQYFITSGISVNPNPNTTINHDK